MDTKKLIDTDFNLKFINALKQYWRDEKYFNCINNPKTSHLLLLLNDCTVTYTSKNGTTLVAKSGDIVYTPINSEYTATITKLHDNGYTIGVNFILFDENNAPVTLENDITIYSDNADTYMQNLFLRLCNNEPNTQYIEKRIGLLEILSTLTALSDASSLRPTIASALSYLEKHPEKATPIPELAKMCSVSEVYFRKKFKESLRMSPVEYRNKLRLERAKQYLEREDKTIGEISEELGYSTVSHFCQQFKKQYGISPLSYRNEYLSYNRQL